MTELVVGTAATVRARSAALAAANPIEVLEAAATATGSGPALLEAIDAHEMTLFVADVVRPTTLAPATRAAVLSAADAVLGGAAAALIVTSCGRAVPFADAVMVMGNAARALTGSRARLLRPAGLGCPVAVRQRKVRHRQYGEQGDYRGGKLQVGPTLLLSAAA